jgi:hypothetical protein
MTDGQKTVGNPGRLFTEEELRSMERRTLDVVLETMDKGDKEEAKALAKRMYEEFNYLHDGYMVWVTGLLTYIYKNYGIDAVEKAEREAHTIEAETVFKPPKEALTDMRARIQFTAKTFRGHLQPLTIEEDDEKIVITMQPCGSGERIIEKGGYEAGLARVRDRHPITWGMKDFPIYCVHCPVMELLAIEGTGNFGPVHLVHEPMIMGSCHFAFYKDPANIPDEYYERIGKAKPAPK